MDHSIRNTHNELSRVEAMDIILKDRIVGTEFFEFVTGKLLGWGISRYVFEYKPDPKLVIKIDCSEYNANVLEWHVWERVREVESINKWFAPVIRMSGSGRILLQKKCITDVAMPEYPKKIPEFFTDIKPENWGMLNGRMVCFDYASHLLMEKGMSTKMRTANWGKFFNT